MLMRADPTTNTISLLSFPRDLIVDGRCPDGRTSIGPHQRRVRLLRPRRARSRPCAR